jgi:hypothetical protein
LVFCAVVPDSCVTRSPISLPPDISLATSNATIALRALSTLQQQVTELQRHTCLFVVAHQSDDVYGALQALRGIRQAFDRLALVYARLRISTGLIEKDDKDSPGVSSFSEVAIRAEIYIVTAQLERIAAAIDLISASGPEGAERAARLPFGRFASIQGLTGFILSEFKRIYAIWQPYCAPHQPRSHSANDAYRSALASAQRELTELLTEPNLATFLSAAVRCIDWPAIQSAASIIIIALQTSIPMEPSKQLLYEAALVPCISSCDAYGPPTT